MEDTIPARERKYYLLIKVFDKVSFGRLFFMWLGVILIFAAVYMIMSISPGSTNYLESDKGNRITGMVDYVYYSVITATTTGYGDITPIGKTIKSLAIVEIIFSVLMVALVTSKLVSLKQEKLLELIYNISASEKINRLISGLIVFRGDANNIITEIKSNSSERKNLHSMRMSLLSLRHHLEEIKDEIYKEQNQLFKKADTSQVESVLAGVSQVFAKLEDIVEAMKEKDVIFKNTSTLEEMYTITNLGDQILAKIKKDFPIFTTKTDEVLASIYKTKSNLLTCKVIDNGKEIEINISPEMLQN